MTSYELYNLYKNEIVFVNNYLPSQPKKYIYICTIDKDRIKNSEQGKKILDEIDDDFIDSSRTRYTYINQDGKLKQVSRYTREDFAILQLFLKKYREHPEELFKILDNFDKNEQDIQLKKMQLMLTPMKTLEDFRNVLKEATKELPLYKEFAYFGDALIFVEKEEDLGNITNVFGEISPFAKKMMKKYNDKRWERGVVYNEEKGIYEMWYVKERSNDWHVIEKFYDKHYLFEYLLNEEIRAVIYEN